MSSENLVPPRKVRRLSGYNCWHRQFLQSPEGKRLPTLSEKNKVSGCKWRELTNEERQIYNEMAQNETATCASTISRKKDMRRALSSLTNIAEHMKTLDCEVMYTVVQKNEHYCGGTEKGMDYLQKEIPWLPYSFMGSLARPNDFKTSKVRVHQKENADARVKVEELFNYLYGAAVNKPNVRLPYSKINEYGISAEGLPEDKVLKHPSSYRKKVLQAILDNKELITIKVRHPPESHVMHGPEKPKTTRRGKSSSVSTFLSPITLNAAVDLSQQACLPSTSAGYTPPVKEHYARVVKPQSVCPLYHDHPYFSKSQPEIQQQSTTNKTNSIAKQTMTKKLPTSQQEVITLYNKHHQAVGCGKIVLQDADLVHGRKMRGDCVKVMIDYVQPGTDPPYPSAFDENEPLVAGQFAMWPKDRIGYAQ